jgi:hypothetical protein
VEELDLAWDVSPFRSLAYRVCESRIQWRALLEYFCNVTKLELDFELAFELVHFLYADHKEPASDILPALEEIELYPQRILLNLSLVPTASGTVDAFQPFIAARKLSARMVKVCIMTDKRSVLPPFERRSLDLTDPSCY